GFQLVGTPVAASSAAMLLRGSPPTVRKLPPTYTVDSVANSAPTHGQIVSWQYVMQQSAGPQQSSPQGSQQPNSQQYRSPDQQSTALGFQSVAAPVMRSSAAIQLRGLPPMLRKRPPAYTVLPLTASAMTLPPAFGFQAVGCPVAASSAAMPLRACPPTLVNEPPT